MEVWKRSELSKEKVGSSVPGMILMPSPTFTAVSSTLAERPPPEPPPQAFVIIRKGGLQPQLPCALQKSLVSLSTLDLNPERPPRKPPDGVRTSVKGSLLPDLALCRPLPKPPWVILGLVCLSPIVFCFIFCGFVVCSGCFMYCYVLCILVLSFVGIHLAPQLSLDCRYNLSFVALYEGETSITTAARHQWIFVQLDKVNKSETMCSRNGRDVVEEMIRNWIERKTLASHISFVSIRRWKLLMDGLLGCDMWFNSSYLTAKFLCIAKHVPIGYFSCIASPKLLGNTPSMLTLADCNIPYFMKY